VIVAGLRDAEVTIVGGGAIGCAVAYRLVRAGYRDIQIVERGELAGATSSQAAGLVGQVRGSQERTRLAMSSVALYSKIEQETGYTADWRQTGCSRRSTPGTPRPRYGARPTATCSRTAW
jgi:glycine/D-amino acid oxidase-like deaminating enzyme